MTATAICAQQLTKKYADRTMVDRFDLTVPPGIVKQGIDSHNAL
jgi:hypothetical protein